MDSILEHKPDYSFRQIGADPFNFAQEFSSGAGTSVIDPSFSSPGFYFPADPVASSSYDIDNALPLQPPYGLGLDSQTLDVLGMQNNTFNSSQFTSFRDASLTLPATGEVDMMSLYSNTVSPFNTDPYYNTFRPLDIDDALISPSKARAFPPNPQVADPIALSLMQGGKTATNAYQYPQFAPMAYATPHQAAQNPYFDATFAAIGYGMQPGDYSSMSAPAIPMMNVNIQLPSDQTFTNNFPVQQQPAAYPSYSYSHPMDVIPSFQPNKNLDFPGQGIYAEHLVQPSPSYIPAAFDSRGSSSGSNFPSRGDEGGVFDVQASPQLQHSSVIRGRANKSSRGERHRGMPYPKTSPASSPRPTTQPTQTEFEAYPDDVFECCWDGCGQQLVDGSKATYQRHLAGHGVKTFGRITAICEWINPESGEACKRPLQMQSMLKHIYGRTHLDILSKMCPVCKIQQARGSNMHRHWLSCSFFISLDEEEQKRLWSEYSKKPYDWYLEQQEMRGVIPSSNTTDQESA